MKVFKWLMKVLAAGLMAVAVLTGFCCWYSNVPVDHPNPYGTTSYIWEAHSFYSCCTEGYGWGRTNNEGFLNSFDLENGMRIDHLVMGSSHVEGYQVPQADSMVGRMNSILPDKITYGIGISAHRFLDCCCNLEAALDRYHPSKAVIIETNSVEYSESELLDALDGGVEENAGHFGGIVEFLSRNQFLKLVYGQLISYITLLKDHTAEIDISQDDAPDENASAALDMLFEKISGLCEREGTELVIFFHPETSLGHDGELIIDVDRDALCAFWDTCDKYGIAFVDMTAAFRRLYEDEQVLPYGFSNTRAGIGHLNASGHDLVANELCSVLSSLE